MLHNLQEEHQAASRAIKLPRKKTVVEMLITESFCLSGISADELLGLISSSLILEEDRKKYLLAEIPRATIGIFLVS